jgi:hypothetical protein
LREIRRAFFFSTVVSHGVVRSGETGGRAGDLEDALAGWGGDGELLHGLLEEVTAA